MSATKASAYHALAAAGLAARGLSREQAAAYVGVSAGLFDQLVADDRMPAPRLAGRRRIWDRAEVDAAFAALPHDAARGWTHEPTAADDIWDRPSV